MRISAACAGAERGADGRQTLYNKSRGIYAALPIDIFTGIAGM